MCKTYEECLVEVKNHAKQVGYTESDLVACAASYLRRYRLSTQEGRIEYARMSRAYLTLLESFYN